MITPMAASGSGLYHYIVPDNVKKLDGKGMKQHPGIGIPLNIIGSIVQFTADGLLLLQGTNLI
jgi:hypothetical protein